MVLKQFSRIVFGLLVFGFLLSTQTYAKDIPVNFSEQYWSFRDTFWGMTKDKVKAVEKSKLVDEYVYPYGLETLTYIGNEFGLDCNIVYIFEKGKLLRAKYIFESQQYYDDYKLLQESLKAKYGFSLKDSALWKEPLYKDTYEGRYDLAVSMKFVSFYTLWNCGHTKIVLGLSAHENKPMLEIEYISKKSQKFIEKEEKVKKN